MNTLISTNQMGLKKPVCCLQVEKAVESYEHFIVNKKILFAFFLITINFWSGAHFGFNTVMQHIT
jgi:hypothetical protein